MEVNQQDDTIHASMKSSKHAPSSMSTSDAENRCKQLEAEIEPLMQTLEGFKSNRRYNGKRRYCHRRALGRQRCKVKRQLANLWKELRVLKQEFRPNRWSLHEQVQNLFTVALKLSYPEFKDLQESDVLYYIWYYGEFFCQDVLNIWPRLRGEGKAHLGPRRVACEIKKNVQLLQQQSGIIGLPWVMDIGFVAFILSGKWMAKGLYKLLRDGVDTWAPLLFTKNCFVNIYYPTCDRADLSDMDLLQRELIKQTLINILEYCKVDWCSMPPSCGMDDDLLPQEEFDKFRTTIHDEDVLVFAQGQDEPLICAKRGSCDPLIDLKNLWYGLEKKRADWLVCLAPVQQQEYIQMCFCAAQYAKWLPSDRGDLPSATYAGYQSCNTTMEDLVAKAKKEDLHSLLAKVEPIVSKAEYTIEEFLKCAVKYSFLSNHRLDVCEFSFQQMLYTFEYLLNTQVRNRSFTKEHREYIDELKRASELTLGEDEIWDEGNERARVYSGYHILLFPRLAK